MVLVRTIPGTFTSCSVTNFAMSSYAFTFTMAMFGETAFTVVEKERADEAAAAAERAAPGYEAVVVGVDTEGAKLEG